MPSLASINRDVWKKTGDPKKIALVIAGAGSLGSYEAGVLAELTYALDVLNQSREPLDGPAGPKEGPFVRRIAEAHLLDAPSTLNPASFAPDDLRVGLTLTNLNGLDYRVLTRSLNSPAPGFLTTRFSDESLFRFKKGGFGEVDWPLLTDSALATGNFPLGFMPQALMRDATP